jgi:hypothetical protein
MICVKTSLRSFVLPLLASVLSACSVDSNDPNTSTAGWTESNSNVESAPSFEEYRELARYPQESGDVFIVEGDMIFETEEALKEYYDELYTSPEQKSIINTSAGERDTRPNPTNIRYCFSAGWGTKHGSYTAPKLDTVRPNIQAAMAQWEAVAGIDFVEVTSITEADCNNNGSNPGVDFVVTHWNNASTATGAFPSDSWANQKLRVPTSGIPVVLARHEIGHILGFRHEHIHSDASPRCSEGDSHYEELTEFDDDSVMKYNNCTLNQIVNPVSSLSALDSLGARLAYGPLVNDSLYIVQNGRLHRADNTDGVWWQAGSPVWSGATSAARLGSSLYIIQNSRLHQVNPADGSFSVLGGPDWAGPTSMTATGSTLYIAQDDGIWRISNLSTGAYTRIGTPVWSGTTSMAALGSSLYVIQNSRLHKVNPTDGSFSVLGNPDWAGATTMAALGGSLYITQDDGLWRITSTTTGAYTRVGSADWTGASSMTALGSSLYIVQNATLHKVNSSTGSYDVLGAAVWSGPTVMTAMP